MFSADIVDDDMPGGLLVSQDSKRRSSVRKASTGEVLGETTEKKDEDEEARNRDLKENRHIILAACLLILEH